MEITGKQKRHLMSLGHRLSTSTAVGKAGLTDALRAEIGKHLTARELIKVRLGAGPADDRKLLASQIAQDLQAHCVAIIGQVMLLYRPNPDLPDEKRIKLE